MVDLDLLEGLLLRAARQRRPVTYGELLAFFERRVTRITVSALCRDLVGRPFGGVIACFGEDEVPIAGRA